MINDTEETFGSPLAQAINRGNDKAVVRLLELGATQLPNLRYFDYDTLRYSEINISPQRLASLQLEKAKEENHKAIFYPRNFKLSDTEVKKIIAKNEEKIENLEKIMISLENASKDEVIPNLDNRQ